MSSPSTLTIKTNALKRLIKEKSVNEAELLEHKEAVQKLEQKINSEPYDEESVYVLKKQREIYEETKNIIPALQEKINDTVKSLKEYIKKTDGLSNDELQIANQVIESLATL